MWNDPPVGPAPTRWCSAALTIGGLGMVLTSWPLWSVRSVPPLLAGVVALGLLPALLVAVGAVLAGVWPRPAAAAVLLGLVGGVLSDRLRMQPEVVWLLALALAVAAQQVWLALAATMASVALAAGWASLSTLAGNRVVRAGLTPGRPVAVDEAALLVGSVLLVGLVGLVVTTRTRRTATTMLAAALLGLGVLAAPVRPGWLVWATSAAIVLWGARVTTPRPVRLAVTTSLLVVGLSGSWAVGVLDAGSAMHLYSSVAARADRCSPMGRCSPLGIEVHRQLHVYVPAQAAVYKDLFRRTCRTGEWLVISEPVGVGRPRLWAGRCP